MATLNIVSTRPKAGKTCLAGALARRLAEAGKKAAYYKPLSASPESDQDLRFISGLLESMDSPQTQVPPPFDQPIDPQHLPTRLSEPRAREVSDTIAALEAQFETVLVEWDAPAVPPGQPVLLIHSHARAQDLGAAANYISEECQRFEGANANVLINNVLRHRQREVSEELVSGLRGRGLTVAGSIPEDRDMLGLTFGQVARYLKGRWVQEPEDGEPWIDRFLIGGNIMDSGPNYFGRYANQAVITRAGRPDIQMASLVCDTKLLVLTEGEEPTEYIRVEAQKREASLLVVEGGTLEVAAALEGILALANPYYDYKLARFTELAGKYLEGGLDGLLP